MVREARTDRTLIDLEFDTSPEAGAPLGDIASSLVSLHDLLRDLATLAAYPSSAEFREIQVVAIEMRSPMTIQLSLLAIPPHAIKAFQEICRDIIFFRQRHPPRSTSTAGQHEDAGAKRRANTRNALDLLLRAGGNDGQITDTELQRLWAHIQTLQDAVIPLKRVVVKD